MILDTTDQYVGDDGVIVPWMYERHVIDEWNKVAHALKFRTYQDKSSRYASRKRVSQFIVDNARFLGGSRRTSKNVLTVRFLDRFICAMSYLRENCTVTDSGLDILGTNYPLTMGFWQWLRPDAKALIHLAGLYCHDPIEEASQEQDRQRRRKKAAAIKRLKGHYEEFERKCAYLLRDPDSILMLEPTLTKALASIEEQAEWLAESNRP